MAWADIMIGYPANSFAADVDLECLTTLEARILEDSEEARPAGNQQWGLDAGQHYKRWSVCVNTPNEWVMGRDYSESELEVRKIFLILFNRSLTVVIDNVGPYLVITLMPRLQTSCPTL
jgi:hypothetical protein